MNEGFSEQGAAQVFNNTDPLWPFCLTALLAFKPVHHEKPGAPPGWVLSCVYGTQR